MSIIYTPYHQIDKTKWDSCIENAENGLIYAYSYYLDGMAKNWDALVLNNYEAVMPLTWNKKYGIHYLYQPPLTACLGIFGNVVTAEMVNAFLNTIPAKFKFWDIYFNPGNFFSLKDFTLNERSNFVLNLKEDYEKMYSAFRDNIKRNIKKSDQYQLSIEKDIEIAEITTLVKGQAINFSSITENDFIRFENIFHLIFKMGKAETYGVYTKGAELIASAVFFFSHKRAYYIMVGNHPNGKTMGASHTLLNAFIKDHAGQDIILDFEGSDISSLAFFYSSFGAVEEKYSAIQLNKLPAYLKWIKKPQI